MVLHACFFVYYGQGLAGVGGISLLSRQVSLVSAGGLVLTVSAGFLWEGFYCCCPVSSKDAPLMERVTAGFISSLP